MGLITVSGEPGCRDVELARVVAQRLECELVTEADLTRMMARDFGETNPIPQRAWRPVAVSILAMRAGRGHLVVSCIGAEFLAAGFGASLRVRVVAPESIRRDNLIQEYGIGRMEAKVRLRRLEAERAEIRKVRFGQKMARGTDFDLTVNAQSFRLAEVAELVEGAVKSRGILEAGGLGAEAAAEIQFRSRLQLAQFGIVPPKQTHVDRPDFGHPFGHPSEQVFARLLDFYGIAWDYEPRCFPLQWDKDGKVAEAFTPDFYLPEFDLYVELTTMKQAHVTKKNRKIRLLRSIYPHVNIQVFYQKDVQDLVMKYGLPERLAQ